MRNKQTPKDVCGEARLEHWALINIVIGYELSGLCPPNGGVL